MKMYSIQLVSKDNDARSDIFRGTPANLYEALNASVDNDLHKTSSDDIVIVIYEMDTEKEEDFAISTRPLVTVDTFLTILDLEIKNA